MLTGSTRGFAFWCEADGTILRVVANSLDQEISPDYTFLQLIDAGSREKGISFLREVQEQGVAFDWEINIPLAGTIVTVHAAGIAVDGRLLILAAQNRTQMLQMYVEMSTITNEQANLSLSTLNMQGHSSTIQSKPQDDFVHTNAERDDVLYDELSRLYNDLVTLQRELTKKNLELERLNTQKSQFLGMASHDLRAPLGVIQAYSEFLMGDAADLLNQEQLDFVSIIRSSSEFMLGMVNDLLDVSVIESGKLRLELQATDLVTLVKNNVRLNKVFAAAKGTSIDFACDESLPPIRIDPQKIEQVLNNLIGNAVKYSPPNSTIRVTIDRADCDVQVSVSDEGQGIPADEIDCLFQSFATTSVKGTAGEKSTGLGLMIARKVVEGHGGQIWVESMVGRGSTFSFSLPMEMQTESTNPPLSTLISQEVRPNLRILLAEDSVIHQRIVLKMLEQQGYTATVVANGLAAFESLQHASYDVILMDLYMPEMDGREATRRIREHIPSERQPYIIAMTASSQLADRQLCVAAGMNDYIAKPTPSRCHELFHALHRCPSPN